MSDTCAVRPCLSFRGPVVCCGQHAAAHLNVVKDDQWLWNDFAASVDL